ncbi:unnamed protein product [Peniophora sp. CBMAI 1063]|nr:unnamed protein product [Peniophora sp. CBMAI 1063]
MVPLVLEDVTLAPGAKRDPALPILKKLAADQVHPLRVHCFASSGKDTPPVVKELPSNSSTYVYGFEGDFDAAKRRHTGSKKYRFSKPFASGLLDAGFVQLMPGDAVFARPPGGSEDGTDDVLQVVVLSASNLYSEDLGNNLRSARDEILGPLDEMGPDVPKDGQGGTAAERSGYFKPIRGARAYGILSTAQAASGNTFGPGQFMKVSPEDHDSDGVRIRTHTLKAVVHAAVAASKYLPLEYQQVFQKQSDLVNAPRFVSDDNYHFSSVQVNLARPVEFGTASTQLKDLGAFGEPHIDDHDLAEGFTVMSVCSNFQADIDPGDYEVY